MKKKKKEDNSVQTNRIVQIYIFVSRCSLSFEDQTRKKQERITNETRIHVHRHRQVH